VCCGPLLRVLVLDQLYAIGKIRRVLWRIWYAFITRRVRGAEVLFLNYAFQEEPPRLLSLEPADESNRACIQLYHHVGSLAVLRDKTVLEVSCGHGGGASYLARTFGPRSYTGLDLNAAGIEFCRRRHVLDKVDFVRGDAEALPFPEESFEVVINVEASHCYASFPRFLAEVARVLRPGGHFLYADFRFAENRAAWEQAIGASTLQLKAQREIGAEVLRGMKQNSAHSQLLITRHLPKFLHGLATDFAGIEGSRVFRALQSGELTYRSYCFQKPLGL